MLEIQGLVINYLDDTTLSADDLNAIVGVDSLYGSILSATLDTQSLYPTSVIINSAVVYLDSFLSCHHIVGEVCSAAQTFFTAGNDSSFFVQWLPGIALRNPWAESITRSSFPRAAAEGASLGLAAQFTTQVPELASATVPVISGNSF